MPAELTWVPCPHQACLRSCPQWALACIQALQFLLGPLPSS